MATLNGQRILGAIRNTDRVVTLMVQSPGGDITDSINFQFIMDTEEQAETLWHLGQQYYETALHISR